MMYKGAAIFTLLNLLQLFSSIKGSGSKADSKRIVCYYGGLEGKELRKIIDLDAHVCTHIVYMRGGIATERLQINFDGPSDNISTDGRGSPERLLRLKDINPNIKLLLLVSPENMSRVLDTEDKRARLIENTVEFLNESRFDGLEFPTSKIAGEAEDLSIFYCSMQEELDKYGYILSTLGSENLLENSQESGVERIARCSAHITIQTVDDFVGRRNITTLSAPINKSMEAVNKYIQKGYPSNKLLIPMVTFGSINSITDTKETELGADIDKSGCEEDDYEFGNKIFNYQISNILDKDLGGTIFYIFEKSDADVLSRARSIFPHILAVSDTIKKCAQSA